MTSFLDDADHIKLHERQFTLSPKFWANYPASKCFTWAQVTLDRGNSHPVPSRSGIYTLVLIPGIAGHPAISYLMYIGKAKSLKRRFGDYNRSRIKDERRPHIHNFLSKYTKVEFYFTEVPEALLDAEEDALIRALLPPLNIEIPADVSKPVRANF